MDCEKFELNLESKLFRLMYKNNFSKIIFICIGTDKIIGDSLGPIVGNKLRNKIKNNNVQILGNINNQINYSNIENYVNYIYKKNNNPCIIAIDAALSNECNIGKMFVSWGGIEIGKGICKNKYCESHLNIKGVVATNKYNLLDNMKELKNISTNRIEQLSEKVTNSVAKVVNTIV